MEEPLNIERNVVKNASGWTVCLRAMSTARRGKKSEASGLPGLNVWRSQKTPGCLLEQVTDYRRELGLPETGAASYSRRMGRGNGTVRFVDAFVQRGNSGRRRFCSPECREEYYRQHKSFRIAVRKNCGKGVPCRR